MTSKSPYLSTAAVAAALPGATLKIIDLRSSDAYNGWRLHGEARGGHIPTAQSLPAKWASYLDWLDIVQAKQLTPSDSLLLYGADAATSAGVAAQLHRAGYTDVKIYPDFVEQWCRDPALPLLQLPRFQQLVPASWLQTLLSTGSAADYSNSRFVLCHAHYQHPDDYQQGHIPGAVSLDTNWLESSTTWNRRSAPELHQALLSLGITCDTTVILYGRFAFPSEQDPFPGSRAGQLAAMRCAAIMLYAGVRDVRVLNGGLQAWFDAGYQPSSQPTPSQGASEFGTTIPACPHLFIDTPEAKQYLEATNKNLVCVRSWREYTGEVSGYNYITKKGRIAGAVFSNCGSDAYHMENFRNLDHTTREYHEIEQLWQLAGITPDKHNAFYCGTGWRGSEAFFNAWLMGWPNIAVYDGGWFEWSNDPANPCETGTP